MASKTARRLGRMLKWLGAGVAAFLVVGMLAGAAYEQYAGRETGRNFPPPGKMIDIGGRRLHLDSRGTGAPTVILEAGLDTSGTLSWYKVQDAIARTTRTCSYDRAGIMWSEPPPHAQDGDHLASDFYALLGAAGIDGPLVLVRHSLGGPYIMNYTRRFGDRVAGLVSVDASHPDQLARMTPPGKPKIDPTLPFFIRAVGWLSWTGLPRLIPIPAAQCEPLAITATRDACRGYSMTGAMAELSSLKASLAQGGRLRDLGDRPLVVLTAMKPDSPAELTAQDLTPADGLERQQRWLALHDDEARWSTRSRHQVVSDAKHYIQTTIV